jgi:hypothetical protein
MFLRCFFSKIILKIGSAIELEKFSGLVTDFGKKKAVIQLIFEKIALKISGEIIFADLSDVLLLQLAAALNHVAH